MPYPAYAFTGDAKLPATLDAYHGGHYTGDVSARTVWEGNSASTNNPLRLDKTRQMAPFQRWGSRMVSDGQIDVLSHPVGAPSQWFQYQGPRPALLVTSSEELRVWNGGADAAMLDAFASWGQGKVAFSNALQQSGKTARMVGDLGKGIAEGLDAQMTKHGQARWGRQQMRNWKQLPSWYLQYLYGWKPLADDIENAVDQLSEQLLLNDSLHVILRGKWKGRGERIHSSSAGGLAVGWSTVYTLLVQQRNQAVFRYDIPNTGLENVQPLGFFGNLWEGSPYSFVLDWVAPIGDWLTALDANALAPYFLEGCVSEYLKTLSVVRREEPQPGWTLSSLGGSPITGVKPYSFSRVLRGPSTLGVRIPIRNPLSLDHAAQGLSLLSQALARWY